MLTGVLRGSSKGDNLGHYFRTWLIKQLNYSKTEVFTVDIAELTKVRLKIKILSFIVEHFINSSALNARALWHHKTCNNLLFKKSLEGMNEIAFCVPVRQRW